MTLLISSCVHTTEPEAKFGINPARKGFVPARIALLPCMTWPAGATKIKHLPLINRPREEMTAMCEDFDKYVADGFDNQPYMKGLSPKLVEKLYSGAGMTPSTSEALTKEWKGLGPDCQNCESLPGLYTRSIQPRKSWQIWLANFSKATKGADAIMVPLVLSVNTRIEDDRGILQSIRSGSIAILLIDTNDGSLLWSGGREADVVYKALVGSVTRNQMKEPPIDDLKRRLFTDAIWIEFPGRQVYR
jgi:hypothetical protein